MIKTLLQKALRSSKKGALHRQLGYSIDETIPISTLEFIVKHPNKIELQKKNKDWITITPLLKKRANFALNLRRMNK